MPPVHVTVVPVVTADARDAAVDALVAAFAGDPAWSSVVSDPRTRISVLRIALSALSADRADGHTLLVGLIERDVVGAAVAWRPGYHPSPWAPRHLAAAAAILRDARVATMPLWRRWRIQRAADPTREPHWHLAALGVRPDAQRRGVGGALLDAFLERVDEAGGAAYLETGRSELVAWYRTVGFGVRTQLTVPGGMTAWTMWRAPAASPSRSLPSSDAAVAGSASLSDTPPERRAQQSHRSHSDDRLERCEHRQRSADPQSGDDHLVADRAADREEGGDAAERGGRSGPEVAGVG